LYGGFFILYKEAKMPLTEKGKKIKKAMRKQYGKKRGDEVFYRSQNAGTITGTHRKRKTRKKH